MARKPGYVAAKIRANTARWNGRRGRGPAIKPLDFAEADAYRDHEKGLIQVAGDWESQGTAFEVWDGGDIGGWVLDAFNLGERQAGAARAHSGYAGSREWPSLGQNKYQISEFPSEGAAKAFAAKLAALTYSG